MNGSTISIFSNKIFFEIIKEIKLFSKYKISHYDDSALCIKNGKKENQIIVFFENFPEEKKIYNNPSILITKYNNKINKIRKLISFSDN